MFKKKIFRIEIRGQPPSSCQSMPARTENEAKDASPSASSACRWVCWGRATRANPPVKRSEIEEWRTLANKATTTQYRLAMAVAKPVCFCTAVFLRQDLLDVFNFGIFVYGISFHDFCLLFRLAAHPWFSEVLLEKTLQENWQQAGAIH